MKKATILFLILWGIAGTTSLRAQQSVQEALSWYPLQIGDEWQYYYHSRWPPSNVHLEPDSGYVNVKVTGDTVMSSNQHRYQIVHYHYYKELRGPDKFAPDSSVIWYERIDSATAKVYRENGSGEKLRADLMLQKGDGIHSDSGQLVIDCYDTGRWLIFGDAYPVKRFYWDFATLRYRHYDLARGIGRIYTYHQQAEIFGGITDTLIYAKINGVEYGTKVKTAIEETPGRPRPSKISLSQNYPNPFNPTTTIQYQLARTGPVKLAVYDVLGRRVAVLVNEPEQKGAHQVTFDASPLRGASGVYFYRLKAGGKVLVKKMLLMK